jgi:serine/threonine-protein kinase
LVFGTARYLSPEGARGEPVGPPSDVYAVASVLYQMIAARTPFDAESAVSLLLAQIHENPPPLSKFERAKGLPAPLESVILRNLSKRVSDRDPDGYSFADSLQEAMESAGVVLPKRRLMTPAPIMVTTPKPSPPNEQPVSVYNPSYSGTPSPVATPPPEKTKTMADYASHEGADFKPAPASSASSHTPAPASRAAREAPLFTPPPTLAMPAKRPVAIAPPVDDPADEVLASPRRAQRITVAVLVLVAVLSVGLWLLFRGSQRLYAQQQAIASLIGRAEQAMSAKHVDEPPGDNEIELAKQLESLDSPDAQVEAMLKKIADHLASLSREQEQAGQFERAQKLAEYAMQIEPGVAAYRDQFNQLEPKVRAASSNSPDKFIVTLDIANPGSEQPRPLTPVTLFADLLPSPQTADAHARFVVKGFGFPPEGKVFDAKVVGTSHFFAWIEFPHPGVYHVHFEAKPDGLPAANDKSVEVPAVSPMPLTTLAPPHTTTRTTVSTSATTASRPPTTVILQPDPVLIPVPSLPAP